MFDEDGEELVFDEDGEEMAFDQDREAEVSGEAGSSRCFDDAFDPPRGVSSARGERLAPSIGALPPPGRSVSFREYDFGGDHDGCSFSLVGSGGDDANSMTGAGGVPRPETNERDVRGRWKCRGMLGGFF